MGKNIHAKLMVQYAEDWAETDEPYLRWGFKAPSSAEYSPLYEHPRWDERTEYRRIVSVKTIIINGHRVPEPMRVEPPIGTAYYMPNLNVNIGFFKCKWDGVPEDKRRLRAGIVHRTGDAAAVHTEALLSQTRSTENG